MQADPSRPHSHKQSQSHEAETYERTRQISNRDAVFYHGMIGFGETWFVAFGLALGLTDRQGSLLAAVPVIVAAFFQLASRRIVRTSLSLRKTVTLFATLQAASFLLAIPAVWLADPAPVLFAMAILYWIGGLCAGPVWNIWMGRIIPYSRQKAFFLQRGRVGYLALLASLLVVGISLQTVQGNREVLKLSFVCFLLVAGVSRAFSAWYLFCHPENPVHGPEPHPALQPHSPSIRTEKKFIWHLQRPVLYCLGFYFLLSLSVHSAAPFFTPYLLNEISLDYKTFLVLTLAPLLVRPYVGGWFRRVSDKWGVQAMFAAGVLLIAPLPLLWTVSDNVLWLFCVQLLSGVAWGAQELGMTLYLLENVPETERSRLLSWNQFVSAIGMCIGVSLALMIFSSVQLGKNDYHDVFVTSSILRLLPLLVVPLFIHSIRPGDALLSRIVSVRTGAQGILRPILLYRRPERLFRSQKVRDEPDEDS